MGGADGARLRQPGGVVVSLCFGRAEAEGEEAAAAAQDGQTEQGPGEEEEEAAAAQEEVARELLLGALT
eukprot:SAG11_NODE_23025_length_396_cov_0.895623_1_plen_68_part_01